MKTIECKHQFIKYVDNKHQDPLVCVLCCEKRLIGHDGIILIYDDKKDEYIDLPIEQEPTEEVKPINNKIERLKIELDLDQMGTETGYEVSVLIDKVQEIIDYINSNNK